MKTSISKPISKQKTDEFTFNFERNKGMTKTVSIKHALGKNNNDDIRNIHSSKEMNIEKIRKEIDRIKA